MDLFPIKRREKPNLNRRKRTSDGEVIDGQSWLIGGQRRKVEDDSKLCRLERSADIMMTSAPHNLCIYFRINF